MAEPISWLRFWDRFNFRSLGHNVTEFNEKDIWLTCVCVCVCVCVCLTHDRDNIGLLLFKIKKNLMKLHNYFLSFLPNLNDFFKTMIVMYKLYTGYNLYLLLNFCFKFSSFDLLLPVKIYHQGPLKCFVW